MTKATGKPRGRPKKMEPVNPDNLPATQGYVKCVARKMHQHTHIQDIKYEWTFMTSMVAWLAILAVGFVQFIGSGVRHGAYLLPSEIWYAIVAIAIVTAVVAADAYNTDNMDTNKPQYVEEINKSIEKWIPEKHEEKEC